MIEYKGFIESLFYLKSKKGEIIPFKLNDVQSDYYQTLTSDYPKMQGVRENILKGRQFGISTFWSGIFTTDFILSALGEIPLTDSDIYSHKDDETKSHFDRVNMFLDSYLLKTRGGDYSKPDHRQYLPELRKEFLKIDTAGLLVAKNGTQIQTQTASAKVSGRGSTKSNIHWTEPAFYPNTQIMSAKNLMTGAEEQVPQGYGKIIRESTGNLASDYYAEEYYLGKDGLSDFNSRFMAWYTFKDYTTTPPEDWKLPEYYTKLVSDSKATIDQCYWHFMKTRGLEDKAKLREYPTYDREAFLLSGTGFFNGDALLYYTNNTKEPIREKEWAL